VICRCEQSRGKWNEEKHCRRGNDIFEDPEERHSGNFENLEAIVFGGKKVKCRET
jgi:hypothetical protein